MKFDRSAVQQGFDLTPSDSAMARDAEVIRAMVAQKRTKEAYENACRIANVSAAEPSPDEMAMRMRNVSFFRSVARAAGRCPEVARRQALSGMSPDSYFAQSGGTYKNGFPTFGSWNGC